MQDVTFVQLKSFILKVKATKFFLILIFSAPLSIVKTSGSSILSMVNYSNGSLISTGIITVIEIGKIVSKIEM